MLQKIHIALPNMKSCQQNGKEIFRQLKREWKDIRRDEI